MTKEEPSEISIVFTAWPAGWQDELESIFSADEVDIVESSGFTGQNFLELIAKFTPAMIEKLAGFLNQKKKTDAARKIRIKVGASEVALEGFGGDDLIAMKKALIDIAHELKR